MTQCVHACMYTCTCTCTCMQFTITQSVAKGTVGHFPVAMKHYYSLFIQCTVTYHRGQSSLCLYIGPIKVPAPLT